MSRGRRGPSTSLSGFAKPFAKQLMEIVALFRALAEVIDDLKGS